MTLDGTELYFDATGTLRFRVRMARCSRIAFVSARPPVEPNGAILRARRDVERQQGPQPQQPPPAEAAGDTEPEADGELP
ncbi:MAG: hypothetical protein QME96_04540 [Myxococcota bacterium]|nr:hypothetical protein [Myxococcota bacterium]